MIFPGESVESADTRRVFVVENFVFYYRLNHISKAAKDLRGSPCILSQVTIFDAIRQQMLP